MTRRNPFNLLRQSIPARKHTTSLQIGSSIMKKPRFDYFATSEEEERAVKPLHSPLDNMPVIEKPHKIPMPESNTGENGKTESERAESVFFQEEHPPTSDEVLENSDENTQDKKR